MREKSRRPSPLQRRVLIVLAALGAKRPGPVATRDIERVLEQGGDAPVYGPNLRASCRRMEAAGWLRTLRAALMSSGPCWQMNPCWFCRNARTIN